MGYIVEPLVFELINEGADANSSGEHIILPEQDTPLANYWLTLCQQSGVDMNSFSHSTGTINELIRS